MIDFKITFQADELLHGDYEKMSLISEIKFKKFLRQFKTKRHYLLNKVLTFCVAKETYRPLSIWFFNSKCFFLLLAAFYFIRIGLTYQKLCSFKHWAPFCQIFLSFPFNLEV